MKMFRNSIFFISLVTTALANSNDQQVGAGCIVTSYNDIASAVSSCTDIVIDSITVPAGEALTLNLQSGTKLTFQGTIKFEHKEWAGPLVVINGSGVTVEGAAGSVLDGQGALYWDGKGGTGTTKPKFFRIQTNNGSKFENIKLLNCPIHCVTIAASDTTLSGWDIDCSEGDTKGGHNTDGFDISSTSNLLIENAVVKNQDDCVAVNFASNVTLSNLDCSGGHGLSLSVGMSKTDASKNIVTGVTFKDCKVHKSANGIHVKTHRDGTTGYIKDVTYENIELSEIINYGVNVQEDYENGGSTGNPNSNVPITNLNLVNVRGTMSGNNSMPIYILCGSGGCSNWNWSGVSITGGKKKSSCNFSPNGYTC